MTTSAPSPAPVRPGHRTNRQFDRRTLVLSAAILAGAIIGGVVLFAVLADPGPAKKPAAATADGAAPPHIIPRPNEGTPPKDPGDRGGWEQLTLLGLVMVGVTVIAVLALKGGGAKARAGREAWKAAAESGHDGAVPR